MVSEWRIRNQHQSRNFGGLGFPNSGSEAEHWWLASSWRFQSHYRLDKWQGWPSISSSGMLEKVNYRSQKFLQEPICLSHLQRRKFHRRLAIKTSIFPASRSHNYRPMGGRQRRPPNPAQNLMRQSLGHRFHHWHRVSVLFQFLCHLAIMYFDINRQPTPKRHDRQQAAHSSPAGVTYEQSSWPIKL